LGVKENYTPFFAERRISPVGEQFVLLNAENAGFNDGYVFTQHFRPADICIRFPHCQKSSIYQKNKLNESSK
jgi:hypothetical protein